MEELAGKNEEVVLVVELVISTGGFFSFFWVSFLNQFYFGGVLVFWVGKRCVKGGEGKYSKTLFTLYSFNSLKQFRINQKGKYKSQYFFESSAFLCTLVVTSLSNTYEAHIIIRSIFYHTYQMVIIS